MINLDDHDVAATTLRGGDPVSSGARPPPALALLYGALLSACGAGTRPAPAPPPPPVVAPDSVTEARAARLLIQASMGVTREQLARVQALGYEGWLEEQFAMPASGTHWDWLEAGGFAASGGDTGIDASIWRKLLSAPDSLRQRVTLALSEIVVAAVSGLAEDGSQAFTAAAFLDLLEANAFGNYKTLLLQVSRSAPMGEYLTFISSARHDPATGAMPDENYAREVLQLFSIGLIELNADGSPRLAGGQVQETYTLDDVMGLARVFTGWRYDTSAGLATSHYKRLPLVALAHLHESGSKTFLGATIGAGTDAQAALARALDIIFAHPNVAPFIGRQLIQRLVCSNPSAAYVGRVSARFNDDGNGVKGNLKAVLKAILLDDEARSDASLADPGFGKLREPILRVTAWARAFKVGSPSAKWVMGNTSDAGTGLGQGPLRAASVFNFFRPGYVPPNSQIAAAGMVAPEFQITNESSVVGYVNYIQALVIFGVNDVQADYSALLPFADDATALLDELNLVLAAGQLSAPTLALIRGALETMPGGTAAGRLNRIYAALVMVMTTPEFLVQK